MHYFLFHLIGITTTYEYRVCSLSLSIPCSLTWKILHLTNCTDPVHISWSGSPTWHTMATLMGDNVTIYLHRIMHKHTRTHTYTHLKVCSYNDTSCSTNIGTYIPFTVSIVSQQPRISDRVKHVLKEVDFGRAKLVWLAAILPWQLCHNWSQRTVLLSRSAL